MLKVGNHEKHEIHEKDEAVGSLRNGWLNNSSMVADCIYLLSSCPFVFFVVDSFGL
jgi:hypothetical protein